MERKIYQDNVQNKQHKSQQTNEESSKTANKKCQNKIWNILFCVMGNIYFPKQFLFTLQEKTGYLGTLEVKCLFTK